MDLIAKINEYCKKSDIECYFCPFGDRDGGTECNLKKLIEDAPTVDPVKHGHWINGNWAIRCSVCGYDMPWAVRNYCPNCGAKMDEVEE